MKYGTGLVDFAKEYPKRFIDVGICEEYAVTAAAGMALGGLKPVVCIYSTFLQRSSDQLMTDVCMQNAPVVFLVDRAGFVGSDGRTHQGLFDLSYLSLMPNMTVLAPKDTDELALMVKHAIELNSPVAIRYPNGENQPITTLKPFSRVGEWECLKQGSRVMILAVGPRMNDLALKVAADFGGDVGVVNARSVKPLDEGVLNECASKLIITLEENALKGGFGESVRSYYLQNAISAEVKCFGVGDEYVSHATVNQQLEACEITEENLKNMINARICA
jgi:1-deoxy-D-xylulose-5-phosphate synthase